MPSLTSEDLRFALALAAYLWLMWTIGARCIRAPRR